jgi:Ca-activated chloride channel family protein
VELDRAFADILRELRTQYLIAFYPKDVPPATERFHTLKVTVQGRNLRVITRSGYYGDSTDARGAGR